VLRELVPKAATIAVLANPDGPDAARQIIAVQTAARAIGRPLLVLEARTDCEIDQAFAPWSRHGPGELLVSAGGSLIVTRRDQIVALAQLGRLAGYDGR
jgi:putative ABC transport system substrate-binding protein